MRHVLFVVRTPLQLFNALEARDRFHLSDSCVLLVYYKRQVDLELMRSQYGKLWGQVVEFKFRGVSQVFYPFFLGRMKCLRKEFNIIYVGLISNVPLHLANCKKYAQIRLLDDGNEILKISRVVENECVRESWPTFIKNRTLGRKLCRNRLKGATYFTRYSLDLVSPDRVIVNDYREFKKKARSLLKKDLEIFIGSNLVPQYLSEIDYITFLKSVVEASPSKLVYCPHRYESDDLIKKIEAIGFGVIRFGSILEHAFIKLGWVPSRVSTVRSTAIDTLYDLYGIERSIYRIPRSMLVDEESRKEFDTIYLEHAKEKTLIVAPLGE